MSKSIPHGDRPLHSVVLPALTVFSLGGLIACGPGSNGAPSSDTASTERTSSAEASQRERVRAQLKRVEKRLSAISKRAMRDTSLQRKRQEVLELYRETIREMSDSAARRLDRLDTVESELKAARAEGDTARMRSLVRERQNLEILLKRAQERAREQDTVQKALQEYQNRVRERMRRLDPAADSLFQLADSLQRRVRSQKQEPAREGGASDTAGR